MSRRAKKTKNNIVLIIIDLLFILFFLFIIFSFTIGILIRGQHDISIAENRSLTKFQGFSISKFIDRSLQDNIENTLSDQMVFGQTLKHTLNSKNAQITGILQKKYISIFAKDYKEYIPISNDVYYFGDSKYMLNKNLNINENIDKLDYISKQYNSSFSKVPCYIYLVSNSSMIDFNSVEETENNISNIVKQSFNNFQFDYLKIKDFSQYQDYFYETDHHWNYKGSYQGYKDIISLLKPDDTPLVPSSTKTYDFNFYGSFARLTSIYDNQERFTVYKYLLPDHTVYINKEIGTYGNKDNYDNNIYIDDVTTNHYAEYYGLDYGLVEYDYNAPDKENLLVIAPSYSNAIKDLIASHFNKTYYVDLRHYKRMFGEDFVPETFIEENNIDKFLFIISIDHLVNEKFLLDNQKEGLQDGF